MTVRFRAISLLVLISFLFPGFLSAQGVDRSTQLSLTLTPPLFQLGIGPGTEWKSSVKLVNSNPYPIRVYARVSNFRPDGEGGNASFSPFKKEEGYAPSTLAGWITLPTEEIFVAQDTTADIPFTIRVPENAPPGGHYAAIMVGTDPGEIRKGESGVSIGSMLASLLFVRVPGNVVEEGDIRDFYAEKSFLDNPDATFILRFENNGNVHVIPQGEIKIFNMWGKERGKIQVNGEANFGNVLPDSTRKFIFSWKGEESSFEFGRYTARATLVYGEEGRKTVYREMAFWVIPWKPILLTVLFLCGFVWLVLFGIRVYIARALRSERDRYGYSTPRSVVNSKLESEKKKSFVPSARVPESPSPSFVGVLLRDRGFVTLLCVLFLGVGVISWYFMEVFQAERSFEVKTLREEDLMAK